MRHGVSFALLVPFLSIAQGSFATELKGYEQLSEAVYAGDPITFLADLRTCSPAAPSTVRITPAEILVLGDRIVVNQSHHEFDMVGYADKAIVKNLLYTFLSDDTLEVTAHYLDFMTGTALQESSVIRCDLLDSDVRIYTDSNK